MNRISFLNRGYAFKGLLAVTMPPTVCLSQAKLAVCMIHLFHSNAVKFNFMKKLFGCVCFDLNPETECKLFCRRVRNEEKFKN